MRRHPCAASLTLGSSRRANSWRALQVAATLEGFTGRGGDAGSTGSNTTGLASLLKSCTHTCIHTHIHTCTHMQHTSTSTHAYKRTYTHTCNTHLQAHMHTSAHTHIHATRNMQHASTSTRAQTRHICTQTCATAGNRRGRGEWLHHPPRPTVPQ